MITGLFCQNTRIIAILKAISFLCVVLFFSSLCRWVDRIINGWHHQYIAVRTNKVIYNLSAAANKCQISGHSFNVFFLDCPETPVILRLFSKPRGRKLVQYCAKSNQVSRWWWCTRCLLKFGTLLPCILLAMSASPNFTRVFGPRESQI